MIVGGFDVNRPPKGKLIFWALAAAMPVTAGSNAASISTAYDMNRMLNEPHPMADQYGTRWAPAPASGYGAPTQAPTAPAPRPITPMPFTSSAPVPSVSSPVLALPPPLPPYIPTPTPVPVSVEPAPPPAADPKPEVTPVAPLISPLFPDPSPKARVEETVPVLELSPYLSIDTGGLEVDMANTAPPPPPPVLPDPGK